MQIIQPFYNISSLFIVFCIKANTTISPINLIFKIVKQTQKLKRLRLVTFTSVPVWLECICWKQWLTKDAQCTLTSDVHNISTGKTKLRIFVLNVLIFFAVYIDLLNSISVNWCRNALSWLRDYTKQTGKRYIWYREAANYSNQNSVKVKIKTLLCGKQQI